MNLAKNLKQLREAKKVTQTQMAALLGEGLSYYNKLEKEIMKPSVDIMIRLSKIYRITVDEIINVNPNVLKKIVPASKKGKSAPKKAVKKAAGKKKGSKKR